MRTMLALTAVLALTGCVADQSRRARPSSDLDRGELQRQTALHGSAGYAVTELFTRGSIAENLREEELPSRGPQAQEFYHIQIALDPTNPTALSTAGYARKLQEEGESLYYYEFYDQNWRRLAILGVDGDLYRIDGAELRSLGKFQPEGAAHLLYQPPSAYGTDTLAQDRARVRGLDPEVASADPRTRGVAHRSHRNAPPILSMTRLTGPEIGLLAARLEPGRFHDTEAARLSRIREQRHGGHGQDEEYGGLEYKAGNPVDDRGRPLHRGSARD